ncbi:MAG: AAA family ATPase, partial [Lachnospiraceae bacterium]|nr:AAA family ATPase [Lachnospiraceae bacterium]
KQKMNRLLVENSILSYSFELRIDIEPLDDEALVAYAKQYAEQKEYSIDEFGVLALHTRIADMQTSDHEVSVAEVRDLVDEAIYYANKKTPKHFVDILLAKRYDDDDMIILRENDFMHY